MCDFKELWWASGTGPLSKESVSLALFFKMESTIFRNEGPYP